MKKFVTTFLLVAGLVHGLSFAASYKVTKVIEVGPAAWVPFTGPLRWSPDGTMLAYFANNYLMISDTLGKSREVKWIDIGITPKRFEWVSDEKIAINLPKYRLPDSTLYNTITVIDVNTGQDTIVIADTPRTTWKPVYQRAGDTFFEGPFLSLEGNTYYVIKTHTGSSKEIPSGRGTAPETIDEPHWIIPDKAPALESNHFIRWYLKTGLFEISLTGSDSTRIAPTPFSYIGPFTEINRDRTYAMNGGTILRIADSVCIVMDTLPIQVPVVGAICGFAYVSFNPQWSEVLFQLTCDSVDLTVADRIGTFNYLTSEFVIYDPPAGAQHCVTPVYAPDGKKIAFLDEDHHKLYILHREEK
jgi:hypothetical protein